ncbi:sulfite oxidase [Pseudohongiella nitratireducens]|uniref:Sulfite oxidase n=1 Tax=Pseudohongiella nitratireducens TaxID=1768907 RepID=A0A917GS82_9GAMM|nr:molybdopterin-dependent oxidoreductase [Pseudohongiella nitratireducens]GGG55553.1 sulfite oxidase [Pseudohongiella nitratireducens]
MSSFSRRSLLKAFAIGGATAAVSPLARFASAQAMERAMPTGKLASNFHIHNDMPWALEARRSALGLAPITPQSAFFVRNNLPTPDESIIANRDAWSIEVAGVANTGRITLAELKTLPVRMEAAVLQCSGNGRAYFPHEPSGSQWATGAAGCAIWTGVRVSDVIEHFGGAAADELAFLTATGSEELPDGVDPSQVVVERSVPKAKGLQDCMLVWEMNGAPLPLVHGGPVRMLVPGYFGVNNVKWVKRIALTEEESGASIQVSSYRFRDIGESGRPEHPSMYRMPVKSWLNGPGADDMPVLKGQATLYGVAFSGERGIDKVEVSVDEGQNWQEAELIGPDLGPNAWRSFILPMELSAGRHRFVSRATDISGDTQSRDAIPNHRGYGHNGWYDHGLEINVVDQLPASMTANATAAGSTPTPAAAAGTAASSSSSLSAEATAGRDIFLTQVQPGCGVCHTLADAGTAGAIGPNLDTLKPSVDQVMRAVRQGVGAMPAFGAQLSETEMRALSVYVAEATSG